MDLRILEYMVAIERYGNMTRAAERLFVTPSALNQQLLKLEKELGVPLFIRSTRRLIPTTAGRIYLNAADQMLNIRRAAYEQLKDLSGSPAGSYRVGLTFDHGGSVFARIYAAFHERFPNVRIQIVQRLVPDMLKMLEEGDLDLAFLLRGDCPPTPAIQQVPLSEENLLLGLPLTHPLAAGAPGGLRRQAIDLMELAGDSFALAPKTTTMRTELVDALFERAGYQPDIMIESSSNGFLEQLTAQGICDCIIPQSQVRHVSDVAWFYLQGTPRFRFSVGFEKSFLLNRALSHFIDLAREDAQKHLDFDAPANVPLV